MTTKDELQVLKPFNHGNFSKLHELAEALAQEIEEFHKKAKKSKPKKETKDETTE